jgi:tetratricopeptide (TPR) repeat protein/tRNA A-37 threonylcarbamoyl transferase component Bud32
VSRPARARPAADRNLLFGVLALQMDFVSRNALIRAMNAWVLDKSKPLGQILAEQGDLRDDARGLLEALVEKHLELHGGDPERSLAAVTPRGAGGNLPVLEATASKEQQQQAVASMLALLGLDEATPHGGAAVQPPASAGADSFATRSGSVGAATSAGLRFRILRPHARGGLGEVFVARDEELHRDVALKEIQARHADEPHSRTRFLLEAEVTGALEHPGIVPVYGLGVYPDGRPYYAMRFIHGDSLQEAIRRFHDADRPGRAAGARALELRQLLGRFVDVCNAIAYAHSRGVLHRDLKPANVMLGKYGETLVVDWGLAKAVGRPDEVEEPGETTLRPSSASRSDPTQMGAALGTPSFMSPEQAAGRLDLLGPATDVYSLGATLYCLLTGKPPVEGGDVGAILQRVQKGEFPPPRKVKREVPAALEAVCLKALALRPQDRYGSATELAAEIEHWLADEPVLAYREPWTVRMGRWVRRHRTAVTAAVAALLVALVGLVTATVLLGAANDRERTAKELAQKNEEEAKKQRDKARERFKLAREAVDKFHTQVSESPEMKAHGVEKLRTKLLETAAEFYQKFVQEDEGDDREVQTERGRGFIRLGKVYADTGHNEEAEQALLKGEEICRKLSAADPEAADSRADLADALITRAVLDQTTDHFDRAEPLHAEAMEICRRLTDAHPAELRYCKLRALACHRLGQLYRARRSLDPAEKVLEQGLAFAERVARASPENAEDQREVSAVLGTLSTVYRLEERYDRAEKTQQRALAIHQALADAHPESPVYARDLGYGHDNLAGLYRATGTPPRRSSCWRRPATSVTSRAPTNSRP